ncbi:hypothetical protein BDF22DRAFT_30475 [Syncephalis plumigaleata]|nr:hypothetical protein BDF22DRAFT_30475 [Syncephalis plumigaleata]
MKRKRLSLVDTISSGDDDNNNNNNSDDDYDNSTTNLTEEWRVNLVSEDETRRIVMESVQPVQPTNEMINPVLNAAQLFKIETLADISTEAIIASKTTKTTPQYRIIASDYAVCCLIDKQVYLFNTDCTAHEAAIMLDCRAELATFSKSSRFLVVVDQWGSIHFVHRLSRNVIYSQSINSNTNTNNSSDDNPFITNMETTFSVVMFNQSKSDKMEANELESLFIVYNKTQLLMLRNMDLKRLDDAIQSKDSSTIQQIKDKMVTLHVDLSSYHHQVNDIIQHDSKLIIAGNGRATISVWNYIDADSDTTESNICIHDYVEHDNRVKETRQLLLHPQGQLLISLNEHGHIIVWHLPTLIQVGSSRKHTSLLFDTIQWTALYPSMNSITILALSKAMDAQRHACIIDMPNFTVKQQWHISLNASLASQAYTRKSDILWLEYNDAPLSRSLSIRSLSGMTPILRYQQLLRKHKYDKANQWAMQHQLDVKLITEYRLQHFVTVNEQCKRVHASAIINLDQIESVIADLNNLHQSNLGYGITFCIHARAETATITRQLLEWAESNVVRLDNNEETSDLIEELRSTVNRFGTWKYTLSLNTSSSSIDMDWRAFQHTDLLKLLQHYLMHDQLNSVAIIWRRHYHELKPNIDQIIQWFNEVSDSVLVSSQIWLQDQVIPWLKSTNINDLQTFYQWLQGRARRIEQHDERPHRAFELMKLTTNSKSWYLLNSVTPSCYIQHTLLSSTCNPLDNSIESTCLLYYKQLQDRCYLWDQLSIRISLQIYNQKSPSQIGLWILLRAQQVDTLIDTIEKQLMPYTKRHQLQLTDVLSSYIKLLLEKQSDDWLSLTIAVINYVSIPRLNEDTLLEWMRCLPVPWSSSVDDLLRQIVTHYMNETSIKEQYRLLLLRRRLLSYGLTELNMADLGFIRRVVLYIIRQVDRRDALDDALKMADIYYHLKPHQIYVERMQALVEANQVDEAVLVYQQLLKSYSNNSNQQSFRDRDIDPWQIGEEMIYWLIDLTEEWECIDSQQQYAILKMMQEIMSTVLTERPVTQMKALNSIIHTDYLTSVQQSLRLLEEFSISMLPSSSMTDESRLHLFEHHITQLSLAETERLGSILGINQWEIKIRWILNRVDSKEQDVDIHTILWIILQEMLATSCSISHNLWHLFSHLINRILLPTSNNQLIERHESTREKMIKYMLLIIQQQIRYCIPLSISEQLDQFIRYELLQHLFSHTVQGAYTRTMTTTMSYKEQQSMMTTYIMSQTLPLMNWLFEGQYQHFWENTLVMDTNIMLDKVASILQMTTNDTTFINKGKSLVNTHLLNSHDSKMLPDIIHYLQEHRSLSSAIRLILWDMTRQQRQQSNGTSMINHDTISVKSIYELIKPMAQKILNVKAVHPLWAITYLTALPQETAFDIYRASLASVGTQYDRLARLASIGMICASQWKQRTFMLDCRQLAVNAHWWQQFQCLGIEFSDNAFRASLSQVVTINECYYRHY